MAFVGFVFLDMLFGGEVYTSKQETAARARRQSTDHREKSRHVSPAVVEKYLAGIHYPAAKKKLIEHAQSNGAPPEVTDLIHKLPEKTYFSPIDITKEIGKIE